MPPPNGVKPSEARQFSCEAHAESRQGEVYILSLPSPTIFVEHFQAIQFIIAAKGTSK